MNKFGSWKELFRLIFRKESTNEQITILPNSTVDYDATASLELPQNASSDVMVSRESADQAGGRLKNKDLEADTTRLADQTDATKLAKFDLSSNTTGTTRTYVVPDSDTQLVGTDTTNTLTNKTLTSPVLDTSLSGTALNTDLDATAETNKVPTAAAAKSYADSVIGTVQTNLTNHINQATGAHAASAITNVAAGNIAATDVQSALNELDGDKVARDGSQAMTGNLDLGTNSIDNLGGVTLEDSNSIDTDTTSGVITIGGTNANQVDVGRSGQTTRIRGNLQVDGTTTTVNSTTLDVADENITINNGGNQAAAQLAAGLTVEMSDADDAKLLYDSTASSKWRAGDTVSTSPILTANSSDTLTNKVIDADATGNVITNIEDANIKSGAAIDAAKIADGSVSNAEFEKLDGTDGALIDENSTQTLAAKTLTSPVLNTPTANSPVINTAVSGSAVLDDDTFATASATTLATSESIKQYVDNSVAGGGGGSGSGEINYIGNGTFNVNTDDWYTYSGGAAPPTVAQTVSGSPSGVLTISASTDYVIEGTNSLKIAKSASSAAGHGVAYNFVIPIGQTARTHKVKLSYYATSNTAIKAYRMYIAFDSTVYPLEPLILARTDNNTIKNKYDFESTVNVPDGVTTGRLIIQNEESTGTAFDFYIDSVVVGPENAARVAVVPKSGNLIRDGISEDTSGWHKYDSSAAVPSTWAETDPMAGLSTGTSINKVSTNPIVGHYCRQAVFSSGSGTEGLAYSFFVPPNKSNHLLSFSFDYNVTTVGTFETGDIKVYFMGEDNTLVSPQRVDLPLDLTNQITKFKTTVVFPTSQNYRLLFHCPATVASVMTFNFDDVYVGDFGGAVPSFDGIWKQYTESDVTITSSLTGFSVLAAELMPYKDSNGGWRLRFNISATYTNASWTSATMTIPNLTFKDVQSFNLDVSISGTGRKDKVTRAVCNVGTSNLVMNTDGSATINTLQADGDVPLTGKPTWADFDPIATFYPTTDDLAFTPTEVFTPTGSWSTNTTYTGIMSRSFDKLIMNVRVSLSGAPNATTFTLNLPSGLTAFTGTGNKRVGDAFLDQSGGPSNRRESNVVAVNGSGVLSITTSNGGIINATNPFTWSNNDIIDIKVIFHITKWQNPAALSPIGLEMAGEDRPGLLNYYKTEILTADGNFTGGTFAVTRIGNVVTITSKGITHASASGPGSSAGLIPSWARPTNQTFAVTLIGTSTQQRMAVNSFGTISFAYLNTSLSSTNATSATDGTITYVVAD